LSYADFDRWQQTVCEVMTLSLSNALNPHAIDPRLYTNMQIKKFIVLIRMR